jgi:hypothetical protein
MLIVTNFFLVVNGFSIKNLAKQKIFCYDIAGEKYKGGIGHD